MSSPAQSAALSVSGLVKRYGSTIAVADIEFTFARGGVLALLGPNGAGKTTTIEICEGLRSCDSGEVRVLGLDPRRDGVQLRRRIGVMPQGGGSYPSVRVGELLRLVAACAAHPLDEGWLLEVLGLSSVVQVPYKRLSAGQQQRLSLACALIGRPELVFLDEPTAGMDPQARRLVWDIVAALRADGVSVVLTTHLMDEAEMLADEVVIIDKGRVVAQGSPSELTSTQSQEQLLTFRASAGLDLLGLQEELPIGTAVRERTAGTYVVEGRIDPTTISLVMAWCARKGVLAHELAVTRQSLEDVFLELTGRELRP